MAKKKTKPIGIYGKRERHGDLDAHELSLQTMKATAIPFAELSALWNGKNDVQERLAMFMLYNKPSFNFLSINVHLSEEGSSSVVFHPSEKVGCAPLFSPVNGKACATIVIKGNLNEDFSEIIPLIQDDVEIGFSPKLVLPYKTAIRPPLYFECAKYINQYIVARRLHWQKFITEQRIESMPSASTQWGKYALQSYNPLNTFKYPNRKNLLSENHLEWRELNYVLKFCLDELSSPHTPRSTKNTYRNSVEDLRRKADLTNINKPSSLKIHASDPKEIKHLKTIGNRVLNASISDYRAWNVDLSRLFEAYVQQVFELVAKRIGAQSHFNSKFSISGPRRNWGLAYLEPDIVLTRGDTMIVVDAKYKMHMFNSGSNNGTLKDSFRHDLHQVLAYSTFVGTTRKSVLLVYPYTSFHHLRNHIKSSFSSTECNVYLVGIPWGSCTVQGMNTPLYINDKLKRAVDGIVEIINEIG